MNTDKVTIPVGIDLPDAEKAIRQLRDRLRAELANVVVSGLEGKFPTTTPTITGIETFQSAGKQFEIRGKARTRSNVTDVGGEADEHNIAGLGGFEATIREIRERALKSIQLDLQRLKEFKKSIQFQPLEIKESALRDFLNQHSELQNSIQNLVPFEQINKIREFISRTSTISNRLRKSYDAELNEFQESINGLSPEEQTGHISDFVNRFADINNELSARLRQSTRSLRRERFAEIRESIRAVDPEQALKALEDYKKEPKALVDQANAMIRKLNQQLRSKTSSRVKREYSDLKVDIGGREVEDQIKAIEDYRNNLQSALASGNKDYMDEGRNMLARANVDLRRLQTRVKVKEFRGIQSRVDLPIEDRLKLWQEYIKRGQDFNVQSSNAIREIRQRLASSKLSPSEEIPIENRLKLWEDYTKQGLANSQRARDNINELRQHLSISNLKPEERLPIEERIRAWEDFLKQGNQFSQQARIQVSQLRKQLSSQQQKNLGIDIRGLSAVDQLQKLQEALANNQGNPNQIESQIRVLQNQIAKANTIAQKAKAASFKRQRSEEFRELKLDIEPLDLKDKLSALRNYLLQPNAKIKEANNLYDRYLRQLNQQSFRDLKLDLTGKTLDEQIRAVQAFANANTTMQKEANALLRSLSQQWVRGTQKAQRTKFTDWIKQLQTLNPMDALQQLDAEIAKGTSRFLNDMKINRDRLRKAIDSQRAQQQRDRNRNFANNALITAGAGLGLLGAAGFPLLNVGFAAMSGGPTGAAIAGFATALGESIRFINQLSQSSMQAAREISFVPTSLKIAEARMKGFEAFAGLGGLSSQRAGLERRLEILEKHGTGAFVFNRLWNDVSQAVRSRFTNLAVGADQSAGLPMAGGAWTQSFRFGQELFNQMRRSSTGNLEEMRSARRNMISEMNKPTFGIENDPYQSWLRIQQSAMDPTKQEELKVQRELIATINRQIAAYENRFNPVAVNNLQNTSTAFSLMNAFFGAF